MTMPQVVLSTMTLQLPSPNHTTNKLEKNPLSQICSLLKVHLLSKAATEFQHHLYIFTL